MKKTYHHWRDLREKKLTPAQREQIDREVEQKCFLEGVAGDFAALRNNPEAWLEEQEERTVWDNTLGDGLEDE